MNLKLKAKLEELNITTCEVHGRKCSSYLYLTPMHRHKRIDYKRRPELLWSLNQVVLACQNCHSELEPSREQTEAIFIKLRGPDEMLS